MVVIVIVTDVIFFAIVFLQFEKTAEKTPENMYKGFLWLQCLLKHNGDKNQCLALASKLVIPEHKAVAVIFLLSVSSSPSSKMNKANPEAVQWDMGTAVNRALLNGNWVVAFGHKLV